jgi:signal transduction histidine kinase
LLFRFVQEALTNIHRHAAAKRAWIVMSRSEGHVSAEVRDDGNGMNPERLFQIRSGGSGVGVRGMRERIRQFQGSLEIDSDLTGTSVTVQIPIPTEQNVKSAQDPETALPERRPV